MRTWKIQNKNYRIFHSYFLGSIEFLKNSKISDYFSATYVTSTIGYTATVFAVGSLAWWAPTCILYVQAWKNNPNSTYVDDSTKNQSVKLPFSIKKKTTLWKTFIFPNNLIFQNFRTNILFGMITCIGGILGVVVGTVGSNVRMLRFLQHLC